MAPQYVCKLCGDPVGRRLYPSPVVGTWKHLGSQDKMHWASPRLVEEGEVK